MTEVAFLAKIISGRVITQKFFTMEEAKRFCEAEADSFPDAEIYVDRVVIGSLHQPETNRYNQISGEWEY